MAEINRVFHPELDLLETIVTGELTMPQLLAHLAELSSEPVRKRLLWDISRAAFTNLPGSETARNYAAINSLLDRYKGTRSAVVAGSDLGYGLSRVYMAYHQVERPDHPLMTFRQRDEAIQWLLSEDR